MRTTIRATYYWERIRETPIRFLLDKALVVLKKYALWPVFASVRYHLITWPRPERVSSHFCDMGSDLRAGLLDAHANEQFQELTSTWSQRLKVGRMPCLGYPEIAIPSGDQWHSDQVTGFIWPVNYFAFTDFVQISQLCDVKVPWEASRCQWLFWLAERIVSSDNPVQYLTEFENRVRDWEEYNPVGYGVNWVSGMEVAIRAVNIGIAAAIVWEYADIFLQERLTRILDQHRFYLRRFPERSDCSGNHYLFCLMGVVFLEALVFNTESRSEKSIAILVDEISNQFEKDGIHIEHAPAYHRFVVEGLLLCFAFVTRVKGGASPELRLVLDKAVESLVGMADRYGNIPVLGDNDSGQVLLLGEAGSTINYLRMFYLGKFRMGELVAGNEFVDSIFKSSMVEQSVKRIGPYSKLRSGEIDVLVRAGEHGLYGRAPHDHDDNLSPWITVAGIDLLVDQGCYAYTRSRVERLRDISSSAHNLLLSSNGSRFQVQEGSVYSTARAAPVGRCVGYQVTPSFVNVDLEIDWIDTCAGLTRQVRSIEIRDEEKEYVIRIKDACQAERAAVFSLHWHFGPHWQFLRLSKSSFQLGCEQMVGEFSVSASCGVDDAVIQKKRFSSVYGREEFIPAFVVNLEPSVDFSVETRVSLRKAVD